MKSLIFKIIACIFCRINVKPYKTNINILYIEEMMALFKQKKKRFVYYINIVQ